MQLSHITSLARSGALDRAWALFCENGQDRVSDDAAVLAVKGRLLKDFGLRSEGTVRNMHFARAEAAYAAADALAPQPWLLINVATLAAFQGEHDRAATLAGQVLARLDAGNVAETPWFIAATRAEAHLLRLEQSAAEAALAEGIRVSQDGWPDHATTLRQLGLILALRNEDSRWLDPFRPPRSLHFAGHLGLAPEGASAGLLCQEADRIIREERVGFGYGALAAGADVLVAEALVDAGCELHLVLATQVDEFREQSVAPLGAGWVRRFDALLAAATSIACATDVRGEHEPLATALASEVAMGMTALNAQALESEAIQLLVLDQDGGGANTARQGALWHRSDRRQITLHIPRDVDMGATPLQPDGIHPTRRLAALLAIEVTGTAEVPEARIPALATRVCQPLSDLLSAFRPLAVSCDGARWMIAFDEVDTAVAAAHALRNAFNAVDLARYALPTSLSLRVCGHFALVHVVADAATGGHVLLGEEARVPQRMAFVTPPGTMTVTEPFAAALHASGRDALRTEFVGDPVLPDMGRPVRLFAVKGG